MLPLRSRPALRALSVVVLFCIVFALPCRALQDSYHLLPATGLANELDPTPRAAAAPRLLLSEDTHAAVAGESVTEGTVTQPGAEPRPHWVWAGFISAGIIGGSAVNSFTDNPQGGFHFTQEHWFGENTYVGGGDKASHFVSFNIVAL